MKRWIPWLRPLICTLLLALPLAVGIALAIEHVYEVPLEPKSFRFERPLAATLLAGALLVLAARGFLYLRRVPRLRVSRGADLRTLQSGARIWVQAGATALRVLAVACMALALMGPQSIHARNNTDVDGIDIVLTLDLSLSMQAADIKPNRFDATKQVVGEFIARRPNDRIGAVIFGRDAYTLLPLTTDHEALRGMIGELELGLIDGRGTAIGNGLGVAINRLRKSTAKSRVIILATDGDSNSGNVSPVQSAEFARTLGIKIYTILMGSSEEAPVQTGKDMFGRPVFDRGNFPINPELLKKVAGQTGGAAYQAADREALERSFHSVLDKLERSQIEDAGRVYGELFAAFAAPALGLLLIELLLSGLWLRRVAVTWHARELLWLLLLVPVLAALPLFAYRLRRAALARFGAERTALRMIAGRSAGLRATRAVLLLLGIALAIVALARPQYGSRTKLLRKRGVDVVVVVDFSKSMLAQDVRPSRIERAKAELTRFINELTGDRIGIVAFAGETMEFPMTTDYSAAALFFRQLTPADMPVGGTAIGRALTAAKRLLERANPKKVGDDAAADDARAKVVVLLTDGEDHEGDPVKAAEELKAIGAHVFVVALGSRSGEPIPTYAEDGTWTGYLRDADGKPVLSTLTKEAETQLKKVAQVTEGKYFEAGKGGVGMDQIASAMRKMKQSELKARRVTVHEERYALVLLLSFLLIVLEALLPEAWYPRVAKEPEAA